jgi:hypothetical protein
VVRSENGLIFQSRRFRAAAITACVRSSSRLTPWSKTV